jgi:hypothetical protein
VTLSFSKSHHRFCPHLSICLTCLRPLFLTSPTLRGASIIKYMARGWMTAVSSISVAPWLAPLSPTGRHGSWRNLGIPNATCFEMGANSTSRGRGCEGAPSPGHSTSSLTAKVEVSCRQEESRQRSLQDSAHEVFNQTTNLPSGCIASVGTTGLARPLHRPPSCSSLVQWCPKGSSIHMQMQPRNGISSVGLLHLFFFCQSAVQPGTSCHMTWRGMEAGLYQEGQESRLFPFVDLNGGVLNF